MSAPKNNPNEQSVWTRHHSLPQWPLIFVSHRAFRIYLFLAVCLVTLIALFYAEEDWRGHRAWTQFAQQSKARGFSLDWRDYIPPPIPDDQNFAMTPPFAGMFDYQPGPTNIHWNDTNIWSRQQLFYFQNTPRDATVGDWIYGRPVDFAAWQSYFRGKPAPSRYALPATNSWGDPASDVLLALHSVAPELDALRLAATRPLSRFPIHYSELPTALLLHLSYLASAACLLDLRACAELNSGDSNAAFTDVQLTFRLADLLASEPIYASASVRCHIISDGIQRIWEGLASHRWSEEQLQKLQERFAAIDLLAAYQTSQRDQAAFFCGWIEYLKENMEFMDVAQKNHPGSAYEGLARFFIPSGWIDQNALAAGRFFSESERPDTDSAAQRVYPQIALANSQAFDAIHADPYTFAFKSLAFPLSPQPFARAQTDLNLALIACALERFHLAQGQYPSTLAPLSPACLSKLPHDLITGDPLKYRLTDDGNFILYSVGWNQQDDHGVLPSRPTPYPSTMRLLYGCREETGDWVWKHPLSIER